MDYSHRVVSKATNPAHQTGGDALQGRHVGRHSLVEEGAAVTVAAVVVAEAERVACGFQERRVVQSRGSDLLA